MPNRTKRNLCKLPTCLLIGLNDTPNQPYPRCYPIWRNKSSINGNPLTFFWRNTHGISRSPRLTLPAFVALMGFTFLNDKLPFLMDRDDLNGIDTEALKGRLGQLRRYL